MSTYTIGACRCVHKPTTFRQHTGVDKHYSISGRLLCAQLCYTSATRAARVWHIFRTTLMIHSCRTGVAALFRHTDFTSGDPSYCFHMSDISDTVTTMARLHKQLARFVFTDMCLSTCEVEGFQGTCLRKRGVFHTLVPPCTMPCNATLQ